MTEHITLDRLNADVISRLRAEAQRRGVDVGELVAELLTSAAGSIQASGEKQDAARPELAALAGTWTDEEAEAFMASIADLDQIDQDMWT